MTDAETIHELFRLVNARDLAGVQELLDPAFVRHDLADLWPGVAGPDGVKDFLSALLAAAPDLHLDVVDTIHDTEAGKVAVRIHVTGTHTGADLLGQAATGRAIESNNISIYRLVGGKVVETWQLADGLAFYRAAGRID